MSEPLISIVTVSLNAGRTIEAALASVLQQKVDGIEYVVVDGGSTDGSREVIDALKHRIDRVIFEPDEGIADAFNKGIAAASGRYIGILNADDMYLPNALQRVHESLGRRPAVDVLYGDILLEDSRSALRHLERADITRMAECMSIYHPSMFVRKDVYRELGGYDVSYRLAMDSEFVHRALAAGRSFHHVAEPLACMRLGGRSHRRLFAALLEFRRSALTHGLTTPVVASGVLVRQLMLQSLLKPPALRKAWLVLRRRGWDLDHDVGS